MPDWLPGRRWFWMFAVCTLIGAGPVSPSWGAQADEDEESVRYPGVIGTYTGGGESVTRRDPDIAFVWDRQSPDSRIPGGPFQVQWQGKLLVRSPGKYRFAAQIAGHVQATLADQTILSGESKPDAAASWIAGPEVEFEYGEHPLVVTFRSSGAASRIKLYWLSEAFALEPVPSGAYFLNEAHPELELVSRGKELFSAHRCNRCHQRELDPVSPPGPDLTGAGHAINTDWLVQWMQPKRPLSAHANMPDFGFTADEGRAIAAFLESISKVPPAKQPTSASPRTAAPTPAGRTLLHTTGCLACHTYDAVGSSSPFSGGDLTSIGAKRSADWLRTWLTDPAKLNADHRMPVFNWTAPERVHELQALVEFLAKSRPSNTETVKPPPSDLTASPELIEQGRKLVNAARCAACHRIPGIPQPELQGLSNLAQSPADSPKSCLQSEPRRESWRPGFPEEHLAALRAYVKSRNRPLAAENGVERGQRVLAWNNCLQCHPRDGQPGLGAYAVAVTKALPELGSAVPTLVPPSLNAVGDKLRDEVLRKSVAGEFPATRLPWLRVRMPKFSHSDDDQRALAQFLINHDQIEGPPSDLLTIPPIPDSKELAPALVVGHTLLGSHGFSCIACHQFGKFQPRNAALGTRGSDLQNIGNRMRREYFLRWTRSPIRIVPDMEMPGFERPFAGLLGGQIQPQLAALWEALHDPNPTRPLEVTSLQQSLVVEAGHPARIVRDVFALPQTNARDAYVPRALAIGFNNQHNILFDLDAFAVREWWHGNFARQRTEGKSWYWDMAGPRIVTGLWNRSDIALLPVPGEKPATDAQATLISTAPNERMPGRLIEYANHEQGVRLTYLLKVSDRSAKIGDPLKVTETWAPGKDSGKLSGWSRSIVVSGVPNGYQVVFIKPEFQPTLGKAAVEIPATSPLDLPTALVQGSASSQNPKGEPQSVRYATLQSTAPGHFSGEFPYSSDLTTPVIESPALPVMIAAKETYATVPGYTATRLPLPRSIMPTAMTWTSDKVLAFTSLKGHVYLARDTDQDGLEDKLDLFEEGLAAPFGIITDPTDGSLLVSHKPEVLRLIDSNNDGRADRRDVFATGWGYNDNYHDWTCGIVRDARGNLYVGLGSDYTQPNRPLDQQLWRGKILRINPSGQVTPIASGLRYPTGLAMTAEGELFVSDNQGEQNAFNELNHIVEGNRYGVPSREDTPPVEATIPPAIQIPHPWTRSINGIFFLPPDTKSGEDQQSPHPYAGHGIGCEYDLRYLVRFTLQKVGDTFQGAVYPFSQDHVNPETPNFEGTLSGAVSPRGDIYIGCIHDSGWLGGLNVGSLVQLRSTGVVPLGIQEIRAVPQGFQVRFTGTVDRSKAALATSFTISGYTRVWQGAYATPDSNRHTVSIHDITVSEDGRQVVLRTDKLRTGFVYEITCGKVGAESDAALWPATGHYTMNRLPVEN